MNKQLVYNKLFNKPTKLKSKKVSLSAKQDLIDGLGYSDVTFDIALEWNDEISTELYQKISLGYSSLELGIEKLESSINEIEQFADDLGVNPFEVFDDFEKANVRLDYLKAVKSGYEKLLDFTNFRL